MKELIVNKASIVNNLNRVKALSGPAAIYAVLKGDAYGMGLLETAELLAQEGITRFAVTEPADIVRLREAGHTQAEILLLRSTSEPDDINLCLDHKAVMTLGSHDTLIALNGLAEQRGCVAEAHLEVDIGMGRYGFLPTEYDQILNTYKYGNNIAITGLYAHFPAAFGRKKKSLARKAVFDALLTRLKNDGIDTGLVHLANSSALFFLDGVQYDAVRIGSALTGRLPKKSRHSGLLPATRVQCSICDTRWLPKGVNIGYASVFKTKRPTKIAILPIGGADGFCVGKVRDTYRLRDAFGYILSDLKGGLTHKKITVTVNGKRATVLGHTGMNHTVIDITDLDCFVGQLADIDLNPVYAGQLPRRYE